MSAQSLSPPTSHGEQADSLSEVDTATDLSHLLTTTAMLFRSATAERTNTERFQRLSDRAQELVTRLAEIADGKGKPETQLPYRQLIPVRVWRSGTAGSDQLAELITSVPDTVKRVLAGQRDIDLLTSASVLEQAAARLRDHATRLLSNQR